jgi:hypothetical protein
MMNTEEDDSPKTAPVNEGPSAPENPFYDDEIDVTADNLLTSVSLEDPILMTKEDDSPKTAPENKEPRSPSNPFDDDETDVTADNLLTSVGLEDRIEDPSPPPTEGEPDTTGTEAAPEEVIIEDSEKEEVPVEKVDQNWRKAWDQVDTKIFKIVDHISNKISTIQVSTPEIISSSMMGIRHVVYNVKTEPLGYTVRRRYNDFDWLGEMLSARYQGLFIPSSPSTSSVPSLSGSKVDPDGYFVRNRMIQLHIFMQALIKIPFVRTDPSFLSFISMQDEREFKQLTELKKELPSLNVGDNPGFDLWITMIDPQVIDADADRPITDFKRQLELLRVQLNRADKVCRNAGKKAIEYSRAMAELNEEVMRWNTLERDLVDPARNEYINPCAEDLKLYLSDLVTGISFWATSTTLLPKVIAGVLMSSVQFQRAQMEAFAAHLKAREEVVTSLFRMEKERLKLLDEKQKAAAAPVKKSFFNRGEDELEEALRKKTEQCTKLQSQLDTLTKSLIYCEMERFNQERSESIAKLLAVLAATNIQMSVSATAKWSQVITEKDLTRVNEDKEEFLNLYSKVEEDEFN